MHSQPVLALKDMPKLIRLFIKSIYILLLYGNISLVLRCFKYNIISGDCFTKVYHTFSLYYEIPSLLFI